MPSSSAGTTGPHGGLLPCPRARIEEPKSRNGKRTLPLDGELVAALATLRKRQLDESATAGAAYRSGLAGLDWYQETTMANFTFE